VYNPYTMMPNNFHLHIYVGIAARSSQRSRLITLQHHLITTVSLPQRPDMTHTDTTFTPQLSGYKYPPPVLTSFPVSHFRLPLRLANCLPPVSNLYLCSTQLLPVKRDRHHRPHSHLSV
jgi:hypothetical protein